MQDAVKDIFSPMFEAMLQGGMENKNLVMYARGMSRRDIAEKVEDIYGNVAVQRCTVHLIRNSTRYITS